MNREFSGCGIVLGLCVLLLAGCQSSGRVSESEKAVQSISEMSGKLVKAKDQVNRTVSLMGDMEQGKNLSGSFKSFNSAVADLESAGKAAAQRRDAMRASRDEYLKRWQAEVEQIDNAAVKEGLAERKENVRANYDKAAAMADDVREAYIPFLKDVKDVQRALSVDLNPSGVAAIRPAMDQSRQDGAKLIDKLDALNNELNAFVSRMSPKGK